MAVPLILAVNSGLEGLQSALIPVLLALARPGLQPSWAVGVDVGVLRYWPDGGLSNLMVSRFVLQLSRHLHI